MLTYNLFICKDAIWGKPVNKKYVLKKLKKCFAFYKMYKALYQV